MKQCPYCRNYIIARCKRCDNEWTPRKQNPKQCPECKSPYWNKERQMDYEHWTHKVKREAQESKEQMREEVKKEYKNKKISEITVRNGEVIDIE